MYPRIVRQIAPMGEAALPSTVEASGCCQCMLEFMGWQIEPAAHFLPRRTRVYALLLNRSVPECGLCPYNAATPRECARCRRLADNSPRSQPTCAPPPERCRSKCAETPSCSCPRDDSEYSPAAPESFQNSSTKKFRGTDSVLAARLQGHKSWPRRIRYRQCTA